MYNWIAIDGHWYCKAATPLREINPRKGDQTILVRLSTHQVHKASFIKCQISYIYSFVFHLSIISPHSWWWRWKVGWSPRSFRRFILRETWMSVPKCLSIHPIVVEILQFEPKWWTDRLTLPSIEPCCHCTYWEFHWGSCSTLETFQGWSLSDSKAPSAAWQLTFLLRKQTWLWDTIDHFERNSLCCLYLGTGRSEHRTGSMEPVGNLVFCSKTVHQSGCMLTGNHNGGYSWQCNAKVILFWW